LLPNLLIIGAAKSGTTSLHEYLGLHPEISMSAKKELQFFAKRNWRDKLAWYEGQFTEPTPVRGESSPTYTMFPYMPPVAPRIHELIPDAKLIYVVRDPIERTIANYVELVSMRIENREIGSALRDVDAPANPNICPSRYASQLDIYLEHFALDQILVIDFQDLCLRRATTLRRVFRFLEVDEEFDSPQFERVHNVGAQKVRYNALGYWLVTRGIATNRQDSFERGPLVQPLRRLLSHPIETRLPPPVHDRLVHALRPEVTRLRELCDLPLNWPSFPAEAVGMSSGL
jgi:hypothetical protein